ncbi:metal-dependent hydrolase [Haladaptatus sp. AB618]|uniref:metal-dependent hydrolase n=1 Tax=Haladaptatus sp. AB618 TaxID=2934173 RepID=UPI00209BC3D9|nr:metal-dependent hydrolase [Haladaptatus sp. AB618]MCO8256224.1 metal-dependent hydrolase [Haladaptatus sp. AB618]
MVDVSGHFAMALLFAAPAWFLWGRRASLAFGAFTLVTAMLPDSDLLLRHVIPGVHHHGVTHTILFVTVFSVVAGALAAYLLTSHFEASRWVRSDDIGEKAVFAFATVGFLTGGMSHLFADLLSAPDIAPPLKPLWPVYAKPIIVDVIYYDSPIWNFGLLGVALAAHYALYRHERYPLETAYMIRES